MTRLFFFLFLFVQFSYSFHACCCSPGISCRIVNPSVKNSVNIAKQLIKQNDKIFANKIKKINELLAQINQIDKNILYIQDKINSTEKINNLLLNKIANNKKRINEIKVLLLKSLQTFNNSIILQNKQLLLLINKANKEKNNE